MSGESSSQAGWWLALEPAAQEFFADLGRQEDPRLGDFVRRWEHVPIQFKPGQPVLIGFPCDEGVRRNAGRPGAALAPEAIRRRLYRLTPWDLRIDLSTLKAVDMGDIRSGKLEEMQSNLGEVVVEVLKKGAFPIVLGGGHETAFGHFLGYGNAELDCAILNIDAHLDVRPYPLGGHSGSPFRQAMDRPTRPLAHGLYSVIGAQTQSVSALHAAFVHQYKHQVHWFDPRQRPEEVLDLVASELRRLGQDGTPVMLTIDADAFRQADVPGVSAPSPVGFEGWLGPEMAYLAGVEPAVRSLEIVEVNPTFDRDEQTSRWAALVVRQFLVGLAARAGAQSS